MEGPEEQGSFGESGGLPMIEGQRAWDDLGSFQESSPGKEEPRSGWEVLQCPPGSGVEPRACGQSLRSPRRAGDVASLGCAANREMVEAST